MGDAPGIGWNLEGGQIDVVIARGQQVAHSPKIEPDQLLPEPVGFDDIGMLVPGALDAKILDAHIQVDRPDQLDGSASARLRTGVHEPQRHAVLEHQIRGVLAEIGDRQLTAELLLDAELQIHIDPGHDGAIIGSFRKDLVDLAVRIAQRAVGGLGARPDRRGEKRAGHHVVSD